MKKFKWEEFIISDDIVVHCKTKEEAEDFCRAMHERKLHWIGGGDLKNNTKFYCFREQTCYTNKVSFSNYDDFIKAGYTILEWSDFMEKKTFTKADLKTGMFGIDRGGEMFVVADNLMIYQDGQYAEISYLKDNLTFNGDHNIDIMQITQAMCFNIAKSNFNNDKNILFDRNRDCAAEMTIAEIEKKLGISNLKIVKEG